MLLLALSTRSLYSGGQYIGGRCTLEVVLVNAVSRVAVRVCCTLAVSKLAVRRSVRWWSVHWRSVSWRSVAGSQYVNAVVRVAVLVRCTLAVNTFVEGHCTLEVA